MTQVHTSFPFARQPIPAILSLVGLAAMGIVVAPQRGVERAVRFPRWYDNANGSIARGNRHGGPHEHRREIARRQRQAHARAA